MMRIVLPKTLTHHHSRFKGLLDLLQVTSPPRVTPLPAKMAPRSTPLALRSTLPPRLSFPLANTDYFTGELFDLIVIFLQKYGIEWHSIECVGRGVQSDAALPTICVFASWPEPDEILKLWNEHGGRAIEMMVPAEIVEIEFAKVFTDGTESVCFGGLDRESWASRAASVKTGRSEACTCQVRSIESTSLLDPKDGFEEARKKGAEEETQKEGVGEETQEGVEEETQKEGAEEAQEETEEAK